MAWSFNDSEYVVVADNARLTFPSGNYTIGGWARIAANDGSGLQYMLTQFQASLVGAWYMYIGEASAAGGVANKLVFGQYNNSAGPQVGVISSADVGTSTAWQHFVAVRTGTTSNLYGDGAQIGTLAALTDGGDPSLAMYIGGRNDLNSGRFFRGQLADWFKVDRALSANEIGGLARGMRAARLPGISDSTSWYIPALLGGTGGDYQAFGGVLGTFTNNGSTDGASDPPIERLNSARSFHFFTAAGGGANTTDVDSAEFDHAVSSTALTQVHNVTVNSAEFDRGFQSAQISSALVVNSTEFDREWQSAALTNNVVAQSSEYDREFQSVNVATGIVINSAEFDREFGSVSISRNIVPGASEYDREWGSVELAVPAMEVFSAEFYREFGSAQITRNTAPGSSEYDREWGSVGLPLTGQQDVDSPEFDWEGGSPLLRQFMAPANTPKTRVKYVRQCCV